MGMWKENEQTQEVKMFTSDSKMFNHRKFGWEDRKLIKKKKKLIILLPEITTIILVYILSVIFLWRYNNKIEIILTIPFNEML